MSISRALLSLLFMCLFGLITAPLAAQETPAQPTAATTAPRIPSPPDDVRVFVNGKDVTGSRNIKLKNVAVRFDANGNLHVDAPRYQLKLQPGVGRRAPKPTPTPATAVNTPVNVLTPTPVLDMKPVRIPPTKRYFASIIGNYPSVLGCRISVLVNGTEVASFNGQENHLFVEITEKISRGGQNLEFQCRRPPSTQANSDDIEPDMLRDAFLEIHVGPGVINGPMVELSSILGKVRCTDRTGGRIETKAQIFVE